MERTLLFDVNETVKLFTQNRRFELRGLSNRLVKEASLENNHEKAELGVITYSLHKLETKEHIVHHKKWNQVKSSISKDLSAAIKALKTGNHKTYSAKLKQVIKDIQAIDDELGHYAENLYEKAKVKQASLAYSYGLSISQAAELTGAGKKELQSYIGFTTMHDEEKETKTISQRVKELRELVK